MLPPTVMFMALFFTGIECFELFNMPSMFLCFPTIVLAFKYYQILASLFKPTILRKISDPMTTFDPRPFKHRADAELHMSMYLVFI